MASQIVWDCVRKFDSHTVVRRGAGVKTIYMSNDPYSIDNKLSFASVGSVQAKAVGVNLVEVDTKTKAKNTHGVKESNRSVSYLAVRLIQKTQKSAVKARKSTTKVTGGRGKAANLVVKATQGPGEGSYRADLTAAALGRVTAALRASARASLPLQYAEPARRANKTARRAARLTAA